MVDNYTAEPSKPSQLWVPCFACGEPILVLTNFIGCVYCNKCMTSGTYISIATEDFTPKFYYGQVRDDHMPL